MNLKLLAEIEQVRGNAPSVSLRYLLEQAGKPEYPELTAIETLGKRMSRTKISQTLAKAGWTRRAPKSTCWMAPE